MLALGALVTTLAACGGSSGHAKSTTPPAGPTGPSTAISFADKPSQPLQFVDRGRIDKHYAIAVDDVSFTSGHDRISAFLVHAPGRHGRLPAVVYLHGSDGDRQELLVPATWLVARGAVALTITAPSATASPPAGLKGVASLRWQAELEARDVVAVRRAVDLLARRPDVDPKRIGFVGWSSGARTGAIVSAVEPRLRAVVLMSGGATPVSQYAAVASPSLRPAIRSYLGSVDPLRFLPRARVAALLLQDGQRDHTVPREPLDAFAHAAPRRASIRWYPADHQLDNAAYRDQLQWLTTELKISGPVVKGAPTGP